MGRLLNVQVLDHIIIRTKRYHLTEISTLKVNVRQDMMNGWKYQEAVRLLNADIVALKIWYHCLAEIITSATFVGRTCKNLGG